MKRYLGFLSLLGAGLIFSMYGVFIRILSNMFSDYGQVFARLGLAGFLILVFLLFKKASFKVNKENRVALILFSLSVPLTVVFFTLSVSTIKASNSVFLIYAGSLIISFFISRFFYKEKITFTKLFALILISIGLIIFTTPFEFGNIPFGIICGICSGFFEAISNALRKYLKDVPRNIVILYQSLTGGLVGLSLAIIHGGVIVKEINVLSIFILIIFAVLLLIIGNLLLYGFKNFDLNLGTVVLSSELFFSLFINAIFLKEIPSVNEIIGGLLIFVAIIVININLDLKKK